jgi:transcriptional regulator GlxA family with amidase domain
VCNAHGLAATFDRLLEHVHAEPMQNTIPLSMRVLSLLADVIQQTSTSAASPSEPNRHELAHVHDPLVMQAMERIWTHSHRQISVKTIARELPVTRRTLDRRFHAITGRTVLEEITRCRLSRARRLLAETDLPVKTVAYLAGFPTADRMRLAFLRVNLATPSQFRTAALKRGKLRRAASRVSSRADTCTKRTPGG